MISDHIDDTSCSFHMPGINMYYLHSGSNTVIINTIILAHV